MPVRSVCIPSVPRRPASAARNSALVAAGILLSRITGLIRTAVIARFLGLSAVADAVQAAMRIPNLLQNLLGEGVLSASLIPVYSRLLAEGKREEAGRVAGAIAGLLAALTGLLALLGVLFADQITRLVAVGFTGRTLTLTVTLTRILFPGVGFLVLSAWCLAVLNSHRRFFLSYVAPVIWNVTQITVVVVAGMWIFDAGLGSAATSVVALERLAIALAWGVLAGGLLQFAVQVPGVLRVARPLRLSLNARLPGVRTTLRLFGPVVAGRGVVQLMIYIDIALASLLATGAVAALEYATRLALVPVSLFGTSAAASELPELSALGDEQREDIGRRLTPMLARIAYYVVPTIVVFVVAGDLLYGLVLLPLESRLVWLVLLGSSVGLLSNTSSRLLQSALYAGGDTRRPAQYAMARVVLAAALGALLMLQFDRLELTSSGIVQRGPLPAFAPLPPGARGTDPTTGLRLGAVGLALAAGASSWLEYALLRRNLARNRAVTTRVGGGVLARTVLAGVAAGAVGLGVRVLLSGAPLIWHLVAVAVAIGGGYLLTTRLLRLDEATELVRLLRGHRNRPAG